MPTTTADCRGGCAAGCAWKVRVGGAGHELNVDLHRAGGLWFLAMLLVVAWRAVCFNLPEVYH